MANESNCPEKLSKQKDEKNGLPVPIHPDDAKDKVFTAILKALIKKGNTPSSPKELANIIVKYKYATLGGATPFATVSSRISQHFKRAAEHNPPRPPLLAKHVDQNHSRKINYSLATESVSKNVLDETHDDISTAVNSHDGDDEDEDLHQNKVPMYNEDPKRTNSKFRRNPLFNVSYLNKEIKRSRDSSSDKDEINKFSMNFIKQDDISLTNQKVKRHKSGHSLSYNNNSNNNSNSGCNNDVDKSNHYNNDASNLNLKDTSGEESEGEHSDYYEEMLKGENNIDLDIHSLSSKKLSRQNSLSSSTSDINSSLRKVEINESADSQEYYISNSLEPSYKIDIDNQNHNSSLVGSSPAASDQNKRISSLSTDNTRKHSFSFSNSFCGEHDLWTPFSFEQDFDNVFLNDAPSGHSIPLNIATPESISISELDNYFVNTANSTSARSERKSFSSTMLGPNDKSLLQKVLLASAAKGVADKLEEEKGKKKLEFQTPLNKIPMPPPNRVVSNPTLTSASNKPSPEIAENSTKPLYNSSLMDMANGEDFVRFEEDEKKELSTVHPVSFQSTASPTHIGNVKKMSEILPTTPTTMSAAEILKSMNIQNLNLSALQHMSSQVPTLQPLPPTFDLAKTMATYIQTLAKLANTNSPTSNTTHAMDLKTILTRFPMLEAFIKKDTNLIVPNGGSTPPLVSPTKAEFPINQPTSNFVPHIIPPFVASDTPEPIVHTLTPMIPPMYIAVIDNVAVCIVVLNKSDSCPECRIMRRIDSGFINGTSLLTAGGIETESERSMILSFEMERVRMPKQKSPLFGTWIPLRRAQELAVTCSIQHKLGHFLEDSIESYFPSPLPISLNPRKTTRDTNGCNQLSTLCLSGLRTESPKDHHKRSSGGSNNKHTFVMPLISRQSSSPGIVATTHIQELLMTQPNKALKSTQLLNDDSPLLLGQYNDYDEIPKTLPPSATATKKVLRIESSPSINNSNVDRMEGSLLFKVSLHEGSESKGCDQERKATHSYLDLNEISHRVTSKRPLHIHPRDLQKKKKKPQNTSDDEKEENLKTVETSQLQNSIRKKSPGQIGVGGGKWSSSSNLKLATLAFKRSSSGSSITAKRSVSVASKEEEKSEKSTSVGITQIYTLGNKQKINSNNRLRSCNSVIKSSSENRGDKESESGKNPEDEDEEDIDIGGSDCDDDLR